MINKPNNPGTVSKILWHFTGGPQWDTKNQCQLEELKPPKEAYKNLCSILKSHTLKVGNYHENINTYIDILPNLPTVTEEMKKYLIVNQTPTTIKTNPVCCVADIPLKYLNHHSERYGKFGVGFSRDSLKQKFNPVFYTLNSEIISGYLIKAFKNIDTNIKNLEAFIKIKDKYIQEIGENDNSSDLEEFDKFLSKFNYHMKNSSDSILEYFSYFASFFKTIEDYNEIYYEREWRSLYNYEFSDNDIECIIIPSEGDFYNNFLEKEIDGLSLPNSISIIPWEDISEWVDKINC